MVLPETIVNATAVAGSFGKGGVEETQYDADIDEGNYNTGKQLDTYHTTRHKLHLLLWGEMGSISFTHCFAHDIF